MEMDPRRPPARMEPAKPARAGEELKLAPETPEPAAASLKPCGDCGRLIPGDSRRCVYCGFSAGDPGAVPAPDPDAPAKPCAFCGYDLRGAPSNRCPECGKAQPRRSRRARDQLLAADLYKQDLRKAWIFALAGLLVCLIMVPAFRRTWESIPNTLIAYTAFLVTASLVYLSLALLWFGLDSGITFAVLRLAACVSVTLAACVLVIGSLWAFGCFGYITLGLPLLVYAAMLVDQFDHDYSDAVIVSLVTVGAGLGVWFIMLAQGIWV